MPAESLAAALDIAWAREILGYSPRSLQACLLEEEDFIGSER